jgi:hypothetical protein
VERADDAAPAPKALNRLSVAGLGLGLGLGTIAAAGKPTRPAYRGCSANPCKVPLREISGSADSIN